MYRRSFIASSLGLAGCINFPRVRAPIDPHGSNSQSMVPDPFFTRSSNLWDLTPGEHLSYFWADRSTGTGSVVLSLDGGVYGGRAQMFGGTASNVPQLAMIPRQNSLFVRGEYVRVNVRVRRTVASNPTGGVISFAVLSSDEDGDPGWTSGSTQLQIGWSTVAGWTVNEWQEYEATYQLEPTSDPAQYPFAMVWASHTLVYAGADPGIEIDCLNMTRTSAP